MKKKIYTINIMFLVICAFFCACQKTPTLTTNPALPCPTSYVPDEVYESATPWNNSDVSKLANVMKKAEKHEKITVACIGGSITMGTISKGAKDSEIVSSSYTNIFKKWWVESFPDTEVEFINAGIGGTDSYLGVHRVYEDVLVHNPDLVLVEFAVNDGDNTTCKKNYENLVRNILLYDSSPAVLLLFMAQTNGATAQTNEAIIGFNYSLPMVSYANAIHTFMENDIFSANDLSGDQVHPSALGHAIAGEILWKYLNSIYESRDKYDDTSTIINNSITKICYENARIYDSDDIEPDNLGTFELASSSDFYPNGWACYSGEGGITFTATFKNLGILYINQKTGNPGKFKIIIDGAEVRTIDASFKNGWGDAIDGIEVYSSDDVKEHTITIIKDSSSDGNEFKLLGLLMS